MEPFQPKYESLLQLEKWQQVSSGLVAGFTTRNGGVSKEHFSSFNFGLHVHDDEEDVLDNRERLAELTEFGVEHWISGEQVHDNKIKFVDVSDKGKGARSTDTALKGIDGMLTNKKGMFLTALFADCVPLYFFDPEHEIIGIAHAGWKGTVNGIAREMVEAFKQQGSTIENILVAIGPSISQHHYEVDERVFSEVKAEHREKVMIPQANNRFLLDLKHLNREILLQSGILRHNIDITNFCTYEDEALFFSHRRDRGKTGRMLGFIGFRE